MTPRPDVSQERTEQILDAAMRVFARLGFQSARMDDIAAAAGLSKGALYLYFKSKDDLIDALLRRVFVHEMGDLQDVRLADAPVGQRLLTLTRAMAAEAQRLSVLLPVWFEFYAIAGRRQRVRAFLEGYFADYRQALAALIQQGIERGELRPVDPTAAAIALSALYEGLLLLWAIDPRAAPIESTSQTAIQLLLDGLAVGSQASAAP